MTPTRTSSPSCVRAGRAALFVALLAATGVSAGAPGNAGRLEPAGQATSAPEYCAEFADAHAARHQVRLAPGSVRVEAGSTVESWLWLRLSNLFQPAGSKFLAGYRCSFATAAIRRAPQTFAVDLLVAETRAFAEHTQWSDLQMVPIRPIAEATTGRVGWGVFKYLRRE